MPAHYTLLLKWKGDFISGDNPITAELIFEPGCNPITTWFSFEPAKSWYTKAVDPKHPLLLCFKFSEDGTCTKASLCNYRGEQAEVRAFISNIDVASERIEYLEFYINTCIGWRIVYGEVSRIHNSAIEANKVKASLPGTKVRYIVCGFPYDYCEQLRKFGDKLWHTKSPKIECTNLPKIQYINLSEE